ncbi:methyltransferase-like protein 7A [Alligator sinensis]|uniref:Methyltransferase-like protein 7A n=1 Tax=Alligator sinensis TaxID=38654 RepID=A0A1U7S7Z3_ALLSI|nr:methyltransferase-like protein 7A [Alligator sinensis]
MVLIPLLQRCVQLLALPVYLLAYLGLWDPFCKKVFPYAMARIANIYNLKFFEKKQELFSSLREFSGPSGELNLLEIGTGSGANFQFFPPGCRLTCTDPNPNFEKFLLKSMAQNPHLQYEHFVVASGENLHSVADGSMDAVVCTLVLCSVSSIERVLSEVLRVLRPGGAFYFLEHVADDPSSWGYFWQQICEPTWRYLGDGCCLTRETWKDLEKAKFSQLELCHINGPMKWSPVLPHIIGYAVK